MKGIVKVIYRFTYLVPNSDGTFCILICVFSFMVFRISNDIYTYIIKINIFRKSFYQNKGRM